MFEFALQRLRGSCDPRCFAVCLGLMLYWPMLRSPFLGTVFSVQVPFMYGVRAAFDCVLVASGFAVLFCPRAHKLFSRFCSDDYAGFLFGVAVAVGGGVVLLASPYPDLVYRVFVLLGTVLLGLGFVLLTLTWMERLSCLREDQASVCLHISFIASFVFGVLDFFPAALQVLGLLLPLASGAVVLFFGRTACEGEEAADGSVGKIDSAHDSPQVAAVAVSVLGAGLLACCVLRALWAFNSVGYKMSVSLVSTYVLSVLIAIALLALVLFVPNRARSLFFRLLVLLTVLFVAIALCAFLGPKVALSLTASVRTSIEFCLWAFLALLNPGRGFNRHRLVGLFFILDASFQLMASFVLPWALGINDQTAETASTGISLISLFVVALCLAALLLALFRQIGDAGWVGDESCRAMEAKSVYGLPAGSSEPFAVDAEAKTALEPSGEGLAAEPMPFGLTEDVPNTCDLKLLLIERFGLTQRESQVAVCLARGRSVKKTAEMLCLAQGTVQSHAKSIYRKMGINNRQSLMDEADRLLMR